MWKVKSKQIAKQTSEIFAKYLEYSNARSKKDAALRTKPF